MRIPDPPAGTLPRRAFLKLSTAACAGYAASAPLRRRRPNILVFLTDDHGQWAQPAYGNHEIVAPSLDRLAARGTRMTRAITTCPVCSPARASFFTGRMPSQHGIHDWLDETGPAKNHPGLAGQTLISELLQTSGYRCGLAGKWHCGHAPAPQPGFDTWFSHWSNQYPHRGTQHFSDGGKLLVEHGQQSPFFTDRALRFLREHRQGAGAKGAPYFLFVSYVDTHAPHKDAPDDLVAQYRSAQFVDIPDERLPACHGRALIPVSGDPAQERERHSEYYGAVASVDREVGRILDDLDRAGELDDTLIVYTGDHGLNAGRHGIWEKGNCTVPQNFLEESIRVACTVSWPGGGIQRNAQCGDFVNHCDLWATLLDAAGATPSGATASAIHSPGVSYLPQLRGKRPRWRDAIISEYGNARMIRTDRYKLIRRYPFKGQNFPDEFYDLAADPRERVNRFGEPQHQGIIAALTGRIHSYFADYTLPGHSGLDVEHQPECTSQSPWLAAARSPTV